MLVPSAEKRKNDTNDDTTEMKNTTTTHKIAKRTKKKEDRGAEVRIPRPLSTFIVDTRSLMTTISPVLSNNKTIV